MISDEKPNIVLPEPKYNFMPNLVFKTLMGIKQISNSHWCFLPKDSLPDMIP